MNIIRYHELVETLWKNGGGITREIARAFYGDDRIWRLSRADVSRDGEFSNFAGLTRILTVTNGAGMILESPEGQINAKPWQPVQFDGGLPIISHLNAGPLSDLNLMFDPEYCTGDVSLLEGGQAHQIQSAKGRFYALHCLEGTVALADNNILGPGDSVFLDQKGAHPQLVKNAAALLVTLELKPHIDPGKIRTAFL